MNPKNLAALYAKVAFLSKRSKVIFIKGHFFCVKIIESWASQTLTFELNIVWPKKKTEISWKNMQQLPKPWCAFLSNMQQVTIRKQLKNSLYVVQNYRFQFQTIIGEKDGL